MPSHNLRLSDELFAAVNEAAGDVPRNTWIVRAIERALGGHAESAGWVPESTPTIPESMHGPQIKPLGKGYVKPRPKGKP